MTKDKSSNGTKLLKKNESSKLTDKRGLISELLYL